MDFDMDGDVDQDDFGLFQRCLSGTDLAYPSGLAAADLDGDNDVDSADFDRSALHGVVRIGHRGADQRLIRETVCRRRTVTGIGNTRLGGLQTCRPNTSRSVRPSRSPWWSVRRHHGC